MIERTESNSSNRNPPSQSKPVGRKRRDTKLRRGRLGEKRRLMMEGLESRQLLAVLTDIPLQPAPTNLPVYDLPRNIGTVAAFNVTEVEGITNTNGNNTRNSAEFLPLGTGPGQEDTIDVTGSLSFQSLGQGIQADIDYYAFDLRAGDIVDIATQGAAGEFAVQGPYGANGLPLSGQPNVAVSFASSVPVGGNPSPLQTQGNVTGQFIAPVDGRYYLVLASGASTTSYSLGIRAYRPVTESLAYGDAQILYLDWEGGIVDNNLFLGTPGLPVTGITIVPTLDESLPFLGLEFGDIAMANRIANEAYADVIRVFEDLTRTGTNGDFEASGVAGEYAIRILNSRNLAHRIWYEANANDPRITRMIIGGTGLDIGIPGVFGIAEFVDVGNFDLTQLGLFALDGFQGSTLGAPIAAGASEVDATIQFLSTVIAHEAAHTFGMIHTVNTNTIATLSDAGGTLLSQTNGLGVGPDGIFGTLDDVGPIFRDDFYSDPTVRAGFERVTANMSHVLSSGTVGGVTSSGSVFLDTNRSGTRSNNEPGLEGVTVFADINNNGTRDPSEPQDVTDADGSFSLTLPPGVFDIRAETPTDFQGTTTVSVPSNSTGAVQFGFYQVQANITGRTFIDTNGNGLADSGEGGLADIFIYVDLDGDNRPDLGEPNTKSAVNGTYSLNFPGPGTYTIRQVIPPGFEQTFPEGGEHTVVFNGTALDGNFDFGLLPSRDFGDAPASYGTLTVDGGASHGIVSGLRIGSLLDREVDGLASATANGDDGNQLDDEDGVRLLSPLGPGAAAAFEVTVTNTTGTPAYLQGFFDFNADGDFADAGEKFATGMVINSGLANQTVNVPITVPAGVTIGNSFARFRLSFDQNLGAIGFVDSGEVEDYQFPVLASAQIANNDPTPGDQASQAAFRVSRNSLSNPLDVLANDFDTAENPLTIKNFSGNPQGIVVVSQDRRSVDYTPPNSFVGIDTFSYTVEDQFGNEATATVRVTVTFQSNVPIAVDDSFDVPEGSVNRALNVLDNDVPSVNGGLTITSVTPGSAGGTISIVGGGQSLRYTPVPGFNGTEQFTYSVQDSVGAVSTATITVNLLPGSRQNDLVNFSVGIFDPTDINTPLTNVQVDDTFLLRVTVDDLRQFASNPGVASAFLDLLYTDELVSVLSTNLNSAFPFDITFGPNFSGSEGFLQHANVTVPGLIDEVGGVQPLQDQNSHTGPVELFTIRMRAIAPGVAQFLADPADELVSETVLLSEDVALTLTQIGLGRTELVILPRSDNFTIAVDDSFADTRDSNGNLIISSAAQRNRLDVLNNDNLGETGNIQEFGLVTNPTFGNVFIDNNGTPENLNDDFLSYRANLGANGLERFTYVIVTADNVRSTAEVTIPLGNVNANAIVGIGFRDSLVDRNGNAISNIAIGQEFGVEIEVEDLRSFNSQFVFAAYLDVLYSQGLIEPVAGVSGSEFNFDVVFGPGYAGDAGVGTAAVPGIINEFGTLSTGNQSGAQTNPALLATLFFRATASGTVTISGGPADSSPFQDTLLFLEDEPISVDQIRYDVLTFTVGAGSGEGEAIQNPTLAPDVNNDGAVSPIDALIIINEMARIPAEGEGGSGRGSSYYTDVNGDTHTTAIDALQVINFLARQSNSGEGEEVTAPVGRSDIAQSDNGQPTERATDEIFATLHESDRIFSAGTPQTDSSSNQPTATSADSDSVSADDRGTDLLDVLADDIQGLWG